MNIIGDHRVIADLHHRKVIGRNGRARIRILFLLGGGSAGIISAERLRALEDAGIPAENFDYIVCISAGAYNGFGYVAQQTRELRPMYLAFAQGPWRGVDRIRELVNTIQDRLDHETFRESGPDVLVGVSDLLGNLKLHSAKQAENLPDLLYAASAIPPFSWGCEVNGHIGLDGAFAHPCPVCPVARMLRAMWREGVEVDMVLFANRPEPAQLPYYDPIAFGALIHTMLWWHAPQLRPGAAAIDERVDEVIRLFRKQRKRFRLFAWFPSPEHYILPIEWRPGRMQDVGDAVYASTEQVLDQHRPTQCV